MQLGKEDQVNLFVYAPSGRAAAPPPRSPSARRRPRPRVQNTNFVPCYEARGISDCSFDCAQNYVAPEKNLHTNLHRLPQMCRAIQIYTV